MALSKKQREYLKKYDRRWNFKVGAMRSGKSWLDYSVLIPSRILKCPEEGMIALIGHTRYALERNLLGPMRAFWGDEQVGRVRSSDGTVNLFERKGVGSNTTDFFSNVINMTIGETGNNIAADVAYWMIYTGRALEDRQLHAQQLSILNRVRGVW